MELAKQFDVSDEEDTLPPGSHTLIKLSALLATFGPDEIEAFYFIARKHAAGRERYGELVVANDKRDFMMEAAEESTDLISYLAFEFVKSVVVKRGKQ